MNTIYKSFWCITTYKAYGNRWYWYCACLCTSIEECLKRFAPGARIYYNSEGVLKASEDANRFGIPAEYEVHEQEEMPAIVDKTKTQIFDHRGSDKYHLDKKSESFESRSKALGLKFK